MKNRNFKKHLNNEQKMENKEHKDYFKEVAERAKKAQSEQVHTSGKNMFAIDTTENTKNEDLKCFLKELKQLGVSVITTPNGDINNITALRDEHENSIIFIDETNNFETPENKLLLDSVIELLKCKKTTNGGI
jgi:hypothetical protein